MLYGLVRGKDNKVFGWAENGLIVDYVKRHKALYDLDGSKMLCPTTGRVMGYLDYTEAVNLKALAAKSN